MITEKVTVWYRFY